MRAADSGVRTKTASPAHIPSLDGFRGLSILAVLAGHMLPLGPKAWQGNAMAGYMGMSVFFALSGFLITRFLYEKQSVTIFFVRRGARIIPLILLVSTIYCLMIAGRPDSFAAANLYILNYWHSAIIPSISPLWSLGVEMHFYISIGLAVAILGRRAFWLVPLAALSVTGLRVSNEVFGAIATHFRVDEILAGALLALWWLNRDRPLSGRFWALLPYAFWPLLALWLLSCWPPSGAMGYLRPYTTALMMGSVLAMRQGWQQFLLSGRVLAYIAGISFALYVWHSPFRHGWWDAGGDLERYLLKRPLAFLNIFVLAHLSTFYFEKPIIRWVRSFTSPRSKT